MQQCTIFVVPRARIIIADDDDALRDSIAEALANAGHSVVSVRDGATAAEQARNGDVHLVVTDLWMPGMNGIELLARVREDHPGRFLHGLPRGGNDLLDGGMRRVIFNPGAENPELAERLRQHGKEVLEACTLVLLSTGQFAKSGPETAT